MPAIRPQSFSDFHGQQAALSILQVAVSAAKARKRVLGHVLITGPAGLGKTTLAAGVIPNELGTTAVCLVCSSIEKPSDLIPTLNRMRAGQILFLDEIHALPGLVRETLYSVLEDSKLTVSLGEGKNAEVISVDLDPFTIIGATTREGLLQEPLRDRFPNRIRLELYTDEAMAGVLAWTAEKHSAHLIDRLAVNALVPACHGTARHAGRLIEACLDTVFSLPSLNVPTPVPLSAGIIEMTLQRLGYSQNGLTAPEVKLLQRLNASKTPVGLSTLAAILDEESGTVEEVFEPWLLQQHFIQKTPQGRCITPEGRKALKASEWNSPTIRSPKS